MISKMNEEFWNSNRRASSSSVRILSLSLLTLSNVRLITESYSAYLILCFLVHPRINYTLSDRIPSICAAVFCAHKLASGNFVSII